MSGVVWYGASTCCLTLESVTISTPLLQDVDQSSILNHSFFFDARGD